MANSSAYNHDHFNVTFPGDYIAHVELNRPQKLNAFTTAMFLSIGAIFNQLSEDPNVRVILITGAGERAFTAGLDVTAASQGVLTGNKDLDPARRATLLRRHIREVQGQISAIETCEKPVIVVLHGISYGLAIDLSTACDIRLCAKGTRFSVREVELGLAADVGTLARLPHSGVSMSFVKDVALTARDWSAEEALQNGFVSGVFESKAKAVERGMELARIIASKSPVAVQGTKHVINYSRDHTIEEGNNYITVWNGGALQTKDVEDSMLAGLQKKKVKFSKL